MVDLGLHVSSPSDRISFFTVPIGRIISPAVNGRSKLQARLLHLLGQHVSVDAFSAQLSLRLLQALCLELSSLLVCQSFLLEQENMRSSIERRRIEQGLCSSKFL